MDSTSAYIYGSGLAPAEQVNLSTGAITYLVTDSLGSVRGTVNSAGALTGTTSYDAWGNPETLQPYQYANSDPVSNDDPTGLWYAEELSGKPGWAQRSRPYSAPPWPAVMSILANYTGHFPYNDHNIVYYWHFWRTWGDFWGYHYRIPHWHFLGTDAW